MLDTRPNEKRPEITGTNSQRRSQCGGPGIQLLFFFFVYVLTYQMYYNACDYISSTSCKNKKYNIYRPISKSTVSSVAGMGEGTVERSGTRALFFYPSITLTNVLVLVPGTNMYFVDFRA